jgi:putative aminopeptidase FrvX
MESERIDILKHLLQTPGPSGDEQAPAKIWREAARPIADRIETDVAGNSYAILDGNNIRVMLTGHIDEIGLMVTYIDEQGFLSFDPIGGWDPQVLVGQRIRLLGRSHQTIGVIGKKPIHRLKADERSQASSIDQMWIDIGVKSRDEALQHVRIGSVGVIDADPYEFPHGRIVGRGIDNRIGAFTILEALRLLHAQRPTATVIAVATVQEEITFAGAQTATFRVEPHAAIVVDVTFATDHPSADRSRDGDVTLGGGPVLTRGSANSPIVFERLVDIAEREEIPYTIQANAQATGTDADAVFKARAGVATAVISIPNRYMHSPNEMIDLHDVEQTARLIAAFVRSITAPDEFLPSA